MVKPPAKSEDGAPQERNGGHFAKAYALKSSHDTRNYYKSWAATYDQEVGVDNGYAQPQRAAAMLRRHGGSKHMRILDAGCGSGLSGAALAAAGYDDLHGVDFSPEMLEQARLKNVYATLAQADLNVGLPDMDDASFDAVTIVGVFSFGHVAPASCDELVRVLKPSGWLIIALNEQFWDKGDLCAKLDQLEGDGQIKIAEREFGDHLPGHDVKGWVIAAQKRA